ncbi:MAG: OmpA family protein [Polyangiaceae bacterium]|nr:OmpA family protein [Polyangiaceae bacterium]
MKLSLTTSVLGLLLAGSLTACSGKASLSINAKTPEPEVAAEPAAVEEAPVVAAAEPKVEEPTDVHVEGDHLTIDQKIQFAYNSDEILSDSGELLDHIATALKNHKELAALLIVGHTDTNGDHSHNQSLSERRAESVVEALKSRGVTQTLNAKGAGEAEPMCPEATDACHEKNRRVEFKIADAKS